MDGESTAAHAREGTRARSALGALAPADSGSRVPPPASPTDAASPEEPSTSPEALFGTLFADAPIGVALFDPELHFVAVNRALAEVNGVPVEEHLGRHVKDVLPDIDDEAVAVLRRVLETGEPLQDVEITGRTPASPHLRTWVEDFYRVTAPSGEVIGVVAVLSDVTAQRRSERRLRQLIDALRTFVGLCRPDGTLVEANRSAIDAGGLQMSDVIGLPLWRTPWLAWDPGVSQRVHEAVLAGQRGVASRFDLEAKMAHGLAVVDFQLVPVVEDGEVVALVPSGSDVTDRRRTVEQAGALADLARRLNAAATVVDVAEVIHRHAAAAVGSRFATAGLLDAATGRLALLQPPDLLPELRERYATLPADSPLDGPRAAREDRVVVLADPVGPDDVHGDAAFAERLRADRAAAGVTLSVSAPLHDREGRVFGSLTLGWGGRDLDEELLAGAGTIAELCAQSFDRARLSDAHVLAAARAGALAGLALELASVMTTRGVACAVGRTAPGVLGARAVRLELPGDDPAPPTAAPAPAPADVAATGRTTPAVLVLRDSADAPIGSLVVDWEDRVTVDPVLRATLDTVAELCGQTLERVRLHAAEHELVAGLQERLLRPAPTVPGLETHALYRAAQTAVGIGGDFHDGLLLPDGRLAVVVGDVAGHGMEAAADMAQLRTVLSTLLAAGVPLAEVFVRVEEVAGRVAAEPLATVAVAVVDPVAGLVSAVHAGHPPLVLRGPDGRARVLDGGRVPLLGVSGLTPGGARPAEPVTAPFPPGSVLVGYTDGLVEVRGTSLDEGIDRLVDAVGAAGRASADAAWPPGCAAAVADAVLAACVGDRPLTDDVALVVVARPAR